MLSLRALTLSTTDFQQGKNKRGSQEEANLQQPGSHTAQLPCRNHVPGAGRTAWDPWDLRVQSYYYLMCRHVVLPLWTFPPPLRLLPHLLAVSPHLMQTGLGLVSSGAWDCCCIHCMEEGRKKGKPLAHILPWTPQSKGSHLPREEIFRASRTKQHQTHSQTEHALTRRNNRFGYLEIGISSCIVEQK